MPVIYCFDIDGTICTPAQTSQYAAASPYAYVVEEINRLYDRGDIIKIMTARGSVSKVDYTDLTERQLKDWGVRYHELIMNLKPLHRRPRDQHRGMGSADTRRQRRGRGVLRSDTSRLRETIRRGEDRLHAPDRGLACRSHT